MIQGSEFFIILLVALVVIGPQRLPEMARKMGHWTSELRRTAADLRAGLEAEVADFQEISRELKAPLGDITTVAKDTADAADSVMKPVSKGGPKPQPTTHPAADAKPDPGTDAQPGVAADAQPDENPGEEGVAEPQAGDLHGEPLAWTGPRPASGPTPDDAMADLEEIERTGGALSEVPPSASPPAETADEPADPDEGDPADHSHEAAPPQGRHEATG